jgi:hypothetical protein
MMGKDVEHHRLRSRVVRGEGFGTTVDLGPAGFGHGQDLVVFA